MAEVELRSATTRDVDAIRVCIADAYASAMRDIADLPDVTSGIAEDVDARDVVIAEQDGLVLGVVVYGETLEALMVYNLAVSPEAQGQGIARRLMGAAESSASDVGLSTLRLRTHRLMVSSRDMYRHLGWEEKDVAGNTILMEKTVW